MCVLKAISSISFPTKENLSILFATEVIYRYNKNACTHVLGLREA